MFALPKSLPSGNTLHFKAVSARFYISDRVEEFRKIGAEVIGASVDSHFTHLAWIKTPRKEGGLGKMNIPLVSDLTKGKVIFLHFSYTFKTSKKNLRKSSKNPSIEVR